MPNILSVALERGMVVIDFMPKNCFVAPNARVSARAAPAETTANARVPAGAAPARAVAPLLALVLALALSLILPALAACSRGDLEGDPDAGGPAAGAESGSGAAVVTVTLIEALANPIRTEAIGRAAAEFMAENDGIEIEMLSPPTEQAAAIISQMLMAGQDIDILEVRGWYMMQYIDSGWIRPIDDLVSGWDGYGQIAENMRQEALGKVWGLAIGQLRCGIFYRADWLGDAGLELPTGADWTFERLYELAVAMTDPSKGRYGWVFRGAGHAVDQFIGPYLSSALGKEGTHSEEYLFTPDGTSIYRTDEARSAFEMYVDLYKYCSPPDSGAWAFTEQMDAFTSGAACFMRQDSDAIPVLEANMGDDAWNIAPLPVGAKTGHTFKVDGQGGDFWGMASFTDDRLAAWEFLKYIGSPRQSSQIALKAGLIPPSAGAFVGDPEYERPFYRAFFYMDNHPELYVAATFASDLPYASLTGEFASMSDADIKSVLLGRVGISETLERWAEFWESARAGGGQ
jgi:multiple sugar transport system substrate-binding protein